MNNNRLRDLLGSVGHPARVDLLMYIDGELPERRSRQVQSHLRACWRCRLESEKIGAGIAGFMECREAELMHAPPLNGWNLFGSRLRAAALEEEEQTPPARWRIRLRFPQLKFALAAAGLLAAVALYHLGSVPAVSASALLGRMGEADVQAVRHVSRPVIHQKLQIRRRVPARGSEQATAIESWSDGSRLHVEQPGNGKLWPELKSVLERNNLSSGRLLSPAAFDHWRRALASRQESVTDTTLTDGSKALALKVVSGQTTDPDTVFEGSVVVRTRDWHTVEQTLRVRGDSEIREYELSEVSFDVLPMAALNEAAIFGVPAPDIPPSLPSLSASRIPPPAEAPPAPVETEIDALYALHEARACLGEPIEVVRDVHGHVVVRGLAETEVRKQELLSGLARVRGARLEISAIGESLPPAPVPSTVPNAEPEQRSPAPESGPASIHVLLKSRLSAARITEIANLSVSLSEDWTAHAWALLKLAEAFPDDKIGGLSERARKRFSEMVLDHTLMVKEKLTQCRAGMEQVLPAATPGPGPAIEELQWPGSARRLFMAATKAADLTRWLCTGSGRLDEPPAEAIRHLLASLSEAQTRSARFEADAAALLQSNRDAQTVTRRNE